MVLGWYVACIGLGFENSWKGLDFFLTLTLLGAMLIYRPMAEPSSFTKPLQKKYAK